MSFHAFFVASWNRWREYPRGWGWIVVSGLSFCKVDVMWWWYVPLYAKARWSSSTTSGNGPDFGCVGGVYPGLPNAAGLGVLCCEERMVLRAVLASIRVVSLK